MPTRINRLTRRLMSLLFALALALPAAAEQGALNVIGYQSQNEGISVLPAPETVTIDGRIDEWDWSGRIWIFADTSVRDTYSVEAAAMWDADYLYLAAKWNDPTPMFSQINPQFNPTLGWKSDAWQLRVLTDQPIWLTTWYYTPLKQPVMHVEYGRASNRPGGGEILLLTASEGGTELGRGVEMAYRERDDGQGFIQEIRIPWSLIYKEVPDVKPGMKLRIGMEQLWGDVTGQGTTHRYADNMEPGVTSREFYWKKYDAWGPATLRESGDVELRQYRPAETALPGTIPLRVTVPADATRFTVVIEDASGNRVRNLAGDIDPRDYTVEIDGDQRVVEVMWDGQDDSGQMVEAGSYHVRGLSHPGIGATFDTIFYNPGTPPWSTPDGTGSWGSNHTDPEFVAAGGERTFVGWRLSEGGAALIALGPDGKRQWGELRGAHALAANEQHVYAASNHHGGHLFRYAAEDGAYAPFELDGKPRPFELTWASIFNQPNTGRANGIALHPEGLLVTFTPPEASKKNPAPDWAGRLALLDNKTAQPVRVFDLKAAPTAVATGPSGEAYIVVGGELCSVDLESGKTTPINTPTLGEPGAIAVDHDGHVVVYDKGADSQLKAYTPEGKLVYTAGQKGGRPLHGKWQPDGMLRVSSVAVDHQGRLWTAENWRNPRRISVWHPGESADEPGALVRDYIGNTGYAGMNSYLHDADPDFGYVGSVEMKLDRETHDYEVSRILWVPDREKNQMFELWTHPHWYSTPRFVTSDASGQERRYLFFTGPYAKFHTAYMEREPGGSFVPVTALTNVEEIRDNLPDFDLGEHDDNTGVIWNDHDGDAGLDQDELIFVPEGMGLLGGWGTRMGDDLSLYLAQRRGNIVRYTPTGFTSQGAPRFGLESMTELSMTAGKGEFVPVDGADNVVGIASGRIFAFDPDKEQMQWTYPNRYHGVHGSHKAPMAQPGLIIGPLGILGVVDTGGDAGRVFAFRGNLGQDYYFTTDGLYVGAMFSDTRLPRPGLPDSVQALDGQDMSRFSNGGEPFNGWLGRHDDGQIRLITPMARRGVMVLTVDGLPKIQRFDAGLMQVSPQQIVEAHQANIARAAEAEAASEYTAARIDAEVEIDGDASEWLKQAEAVEIRQPGQRRADGARLAYDDENLYAFFYAHDPSPWLNSGKDWKRLFKTGDAVDIQLGTRKNPDQPGNKPQAGDLRILIAPYNGQPTAVLMQPVDEDAPADQSHVYSSPVHDKRFDRIVQLDAAKVAVSKNDNGYGVELSIPWKAIGMSPNTGSFVGDLGVISSDTQGLENVARTYWSNKHTNLVNDEPAEAWFNPQQWGVIRFE